MSWIICWRKWQAKPQPMHPARTALLTLTALVAFAGNSLLCRAALAGTNMDAASFTSLRLLSGALVLWLLLHLRGGSHAGRGNWQSGLALFVYAAGFSFAYTQLTAAAGALILFAAVQATMIGYGWYVGERLRALQGVGLLLACGGLAGLLLPGTSAPPLTGSLLMLSAGMAWGIYSLRGRNSTNALKVTAGNFIRAAVLAAALSALLLPNASWDARGILYAVLSGGLASGLGYAIWYTALPALRATSAATVQLCVPALAALGGVVFLGEAITLRLLLASVAILGGIALVILVKQRAPATMLR